MVKFVAISIKRWRQAWAAGPYRELGDRLGRELREKISD